MTTIEAQPIGQSMQLLGNVNTQEPKTVKSTDKTEKVENVNGRIKSKSIPIWQHLLTTPISSQFTIGLAKVFDFEILRHGTSFKNCYGILKNGADPSKGGSEIGSTNFYVNGNSNDSFITNSKNYFYVFKDSEVKRKICSKKIVVKLDNNNPYKTIVTSEFVDKKGKVFEEQQFRKLSFIGRIKFYFYPRFHATLAAISHTITIKNKVKKIAAQIFYGASNFLFSPTLRFIYTLNEVKNTFEDDPDYDGSAYKTSHQLPNKRIGLIGVCTHANGEGFKRGLRKRPLRVITGMIQLLAGSILTCTGLGLLL